MTNSNRIYRNKANLFKGLTSDGMKRGQEATWGVIVRAVCLYVLGNQTEQRS